VPMGWWPTPPAHTRSSSQTGKGSQIPLKQSLVEDRFFPYRMHC
jgi:hypothetical protein